MPARSGRGELDDDAAARVEDLAQPAQQRDRVAADADVAVGEQGGEPAALARQRREHVARDVFDDLPGEGRWRTALLADGNVGIGGDPVQLLRRVRELLDPRGRTVVEVAEPGVPQKTVWATLECAGATSRPFRWSVVGVDDIAAVADEAGLAVTSTTRHGDRWCAVLEERT